jgi:hypothetical protein
LSKSQPNAAGHRLGHLLILLGTGLFHLVCYSLVNRVTRWASLPIHDYSLAIDHHIPYLGWSSLFYYGGYIYIFLVAGIIIWRLPNRQFYRAVSTYLAMILTGALLEIIFASASPWPLRMIPLQRRMHAVLSLDFYACLPSMHVALAVLPTCLSFSVVRSWPLRTLLIILATLITISTVTFREHVFLDAISGILLGLVFFAIWKFGRRKAKVIRGATDAS